MFSPFHIKSAPKQKKVCSEHTQLLTKNLSSDYYLSGDYQECPECFRKLGREPFWYEKEETYSWHPYSDLEMVLLNCMYVCVYYFIILNYMYI